MINLSGLRGFLTGKKTYLALGGLCLAGLFHDQLVASLGEDATEAILVFLAGLAGLSRYMTTRRMAEEGRGSGEEKTTN